MGKTDLVDRIQIYARRSGLTVGEQLGYGVHGIVFAAKNQADGERLALKGHEREKAFCQERDVYLRLQEHGITEIRTCHVPEMLGFDNQWWIIEMTLVARPFVLDFAGAYLDWQPDFPEEVLAEWHILKQEQFGPRWPEVQAILRFLEGFGVFLVDVNPGNVSFDD